MQDIVKDDFPNNGEAREGKMKGHNGGPSKEGAKEEETKEDLKKGIMIELQKKSKEDIIANMKERLVMELEKEFMANVKKELKEELKQELKLELTAELSEAIMVAHSEGEVETGVGKARAVEAGGADEGSIEKDHVKGQGVDVERISHRVPSEETREEDVVKEDAVHGDHVGQQMFEEAVVDDEEQGGSAEDRGTGLTMGP